MDKEDIRHPNLLNQSVIEGHALVCSARKGEPLILPIVPEIKSHCKVLGTEKRTSENQCSYHHFSIMNSPMVTVFVVVLSYCLYCSFREMQDEANPHFSSYLSSTPISNFFPFPSFPASCFLSFLSTSYFFLIMVLLLKYSPYFNSGSCCLGFLRAGTIAYATIVKKNLCKYSPLNLFFMFISLYFFLNASPTRYYSRTRIA